MDHIARFKLMTEEHTPIYARCVGSLTSVSSPPPDEPSPETIIVGDGSAVEQSSTVLALTSLPLPPPLPPPPPPRPPPLLLLLLWLWLRLLL